MGKAKKLLAPGLYVEDQISTLFLGNLSIGGHLDLHEDVAEEAIGSYLTGSKNSAIRDYFDTQLDLYKKNSSSYSVMVKHRWIRNLVVVFDELFLVGEGEENNYCKFLWPEIESTFASGGNEDRHRYKYLKPYVAACVDEETKAAAAGEGTTCPPSSPVFTADFEDLVSSPREGRR